MVTLNGSVGVKMGRVTREVSKGTQNHVTQWLCRDLVAVTVPLDRVYGHLSCCTLGTHAVCHVLINLRKAA